MEDRLRFIGFLMLGSVIYSLAIGMPLTTGLASFLFALNPLGLIILAPLIAVTVKTNNTILKYATYTIIGALGTYIGISIIQFILTN